MYICIFLILNKQYMIGLDSVSFRWTTSKILPTLAYLTSLDKYQMICIIYLILCCVWHSSFAVMNFDIHTKVLINWVGLGVYGTFLILIQIIFLIGLYTGWKKIERIRVEESIFLKDMHHKGADQVSDDDD